MRNDLDFDEDGYLLFDDTVISKPYAKEIEAVRRQWSGSEKSVIQGIGLVNDFDGVELHKRGDARTWTAAELRHGKRVHIKNFPKPIF